MNKRPIEAAMDADLRLTRVALQRAARRAHELAQRTGTLLIVRDRQLGAADPVQVANVHEPAPPDYGNVK